MNKMLNDFIQEKRQNVIRPKMIAFVDIDGTTNLEDKKFKDYINEIRSLGVEIIPVTGRAIGDIRQQFLKNKIEEPIFYSGDNGTVIYFTPNSKGVKKRKNKIKQLMHNDKNTYKTVFPKNKKNKIIEYYLENGGNPDLIRATTEKNVLASGRDEKVVNYCNKHSNNITSFYETIEDELNYIDDITKITLAGEKELMEKVQKYANSLGLNTDADSTKFPEKDQKNWRLDISGANKGMAVEIINKILNPEIGYMCIGNGRNDLPMFKKALDNNMLIGIMQDSPREVLLKMKKYNKDNKKGIIFEIPSGETKANSYLWKMAKMLESYRKQLKFQKNI